MSKYLIYIGILAVSIALLIYIIQPEYQKDLGLRERQKEYNEVLSGAKRLLTLRNEAQQQFAKISDENKGKLKVAIPDELNPARLTLDLTNLGAIHHIFISKIKISQDLPTDTSQSTSGGKKTASQYQVSSVSFSAQGSYDDISGLIRDIERSLQIFEVEKITVTAGDGTNFYTLDISMKTYAQN